jgi:ParB-like chromosome segregation protein Spo0J
MPEPEPVVETPRVQRPQVEPFDGPDDQPSDVSPAREGLPPGFRMRADAHYVDQLDSRMSSIPVRLLDTQSLDVTHQGAESPSNAFVDSIRRFGILQPLLVSVHGSRYRVIAGRRRLAAAIAVGLREVPCLVQHLDNDAAEQMALASNLPAARPRPAAPAAATTVSPAMAEIASALSALVSCADLLGSSSALSQSVAADLIRTEAGRAMDMLVALAVLRDEMPVGRARVAVNALVAKVVEVAAAEHALHHVSCELATRLDDDGVAVFGDARLIADALGALVAASAVLAASTQETPDRRHVTGASSPLLSVDVSQDLGAGMVAFTVTQRSVTIPAAWVARPFDIAWPIKDGAGALIRLQLARKIARSHGGDVEIDAIGSGTLMSFAIPLARR